MVVFSGIFETTHLTLLNILNNVSSPRVSSFRSNSSAPSLHGLHGDLLTPQQPRVGMRRTPSDIYFSGQRRRRDESDNVSNSRHRRRRRLNVETAGSQNSSDFRLV